MLGLILTAHGQQPAVTSSQSEETRRSVRGRVVADDGATPLRNAFVALDGSGQPPVTTDAEGRFSLVDPGQRGATLLVWKTGYAISRVGVGDAVDVRLVRGAAITGSVRDDVSRPVSSVIVIAGRRESIANGRLQFEGEALAESDDTGAYRLFGLPAGEYVIGIAGMPVPPGRISARSMGAGVAGTPQLYYPNTPDLDQALTFVVSAGAEIGGADFAIPMRPTPRERQANAVQEPDIDSRAFSAIRGRVTDAAGVPMQSALIRLWTVGGFFSTAQTETNDIGEYAFDRLEAGRYLVDATGGLGPRLVHAVFGDGPERKKSIQLKENAVVENVDIVMPRTTTIIGRVVDEYGEPLEYVDVRPEYVSSSGGRWRVGPTSSLPRYSDDRGEFRLFGLTRGQYLISANAMPRPGTGVPELSGYVKTYFPGTPTPKQARSVEGEDVTGVEIVMRTRQGHRITGRAFATDGQPFIGEVALMPSARSGALATSTPQRAQAVNGSFEFKNLPPGEYAVQAGTSYKTKSIEGELGTTFVTLGDVDVTDVVVRLSAGSSITGRVIFENASAPADMNLELSPLVVDIDSVSLMDNPAARAEVQDDGSFEMRGVNGRRRLSVLQVPSGWTLKSISIHGIDVTDQPLMFGSEAQSVSDVEVLFTNRWSEVGGIAQDEDGNPLFEGVVVAFTTNRSQWYPRSRFVMRTPVRSDGVFLFRDISPGDYYVAAVIDEVSRDEDVDLDNPDVLQALSSRALKVTAKNGERTSVVIHR
jgi:hypothetical protein